MFREKSHKSLLILLLGLLWLTVGGPSARGQATTTSASASINISTEVTVLYQATASGPQATAVSPSVGLTVVPSPNQPVYRLFCPFNNDHFYTVNPTEVQSAGQGGYILEGVIGKAPAASASDAAPVYRLCHPFTGEHFYTTSAVEAALVAAVGYQYEGVAFSVLTSPTTGTVSLWRFYWPAGGRHFYTTNPSERAVVLAAGFLDEGVMGYLYAAS